MLVWDESLATGVEAIDQQHRRLFNFVNNLEKEVEADPSALMKAESLEFLQTYVQVHFASEELCMFRNVCPAATQNKLAHQAFLQKVETLTSGEGKTSSAELLAFLEKWIVGHIVGVDRRMVECSDEADSSFPPLSR